MSYHFLPTSFVSNEKLTININVVFPFVMSWFSLVAFNIFPLSFAFNSLILVCESEDLTEFSYLDLTSQIWEAISYYIFKHFSCTFFSFISSWKNLLWIHCYSWWYNKSMRAYSFLLNLFSFLSFYWSIFMFSDFFLI